MTREELLGEMPEALQVQALDDNGDGMAEAAAWQAVHAAAESRLRGCFGGTVPAKHAVVSEHALKLFLLVILYNRRGMIGDANPYTSAADRAERRLEALASGEASVDGGDTEPVFVGEPAKVAGLRGNMA